MMIIKHSAGGTMKIRHKKLISLLLCLLLLTAFISCGEKTESSTSSEDSSASSLAEPDSSSGMESADMQKADTESTGKVSFSAASGFYDSPFDLTMTAPEGSWTIYYTIDGSKPDENSKKYEGPIHLINATEKMNVLSAQKKVNPSDDYIPKDRVLKANVIRAFAVDEKGNATAISSATYFVGIDRQKNFADAPVISMYTDFENLFDYEKGIYVLGKTYDDWVAENPANARKEGWQKKGNYSNKGREWEREALIEYLPSDGSDGFSVDLGIRIMGAASRGNMQKSFRLKCREEYGEKNLKYSLIPDNERSDGAGEVTRYKSFLLRDGGNDCDYSKFRDPLLQDLVENRSFETQQSDACVLFIDGEYWGMYAVTEDYSDNYIENNYDIENENVIIVKRGEIEEGAEEDNELYNEMKEYILGNDMSVQSDYEKACQMLDMKSYIEYCAFNIYIDNQDSYFKDNNWQMWRVRETDGTNPYADGKWRIMAYDTEFSTGLYSDGKTYKNTSLKNALKEKATGGKMFQALMANEEFKTEFVRTLCDMRNIDFEWSRAKEGIEKWDSLYAPLVPDTLKRFGPDWVVRWNDPKNYYRDKVKEISTWLEGRYKEFVKTSSKALGNEEYVDVTVTSSDFSKGGFTLNGSELMLEKEMSVQYYVKYGFEIHAAEKGGAEFDHWEVENGSIDDEKAKTAVIYPAEGCRVTAVYK